MTATPSEEWTEQDEREMQSYAKSGSFPAEFSERIGFQIRLATFAREINRQRDEVARLRAENAALAQTRSQLNSVIATIARWRSENERLREMVSAYRKELSERALELIELASLRAENEQLAQRERKALGAHDASFSALARISFATSLHGEVDEYSAVAEAVENELAGLRAENERLRMFEPTKPETAAKLEQALEGIRSTTSRSRESDNG